MTPLLRAGTALALFALAPAAASAFEATCQLTLECFERERCVSVEHELEVTEGATDSQAQLTSEAGEAEGEVRSLADGATVIVALGPTGMQLLTVTEDMARFTLHLSEGPYAVSYLGVCEES